MVVTFVVVVIAAAAAVALSAAMRRRRPDPPTAPRFATPQQLDRSDFADPVAPWLLAVFASDTCLSCRDAWDVVGSVAVAGVVVQRVELATGKALHQRYAIDAVPTVVLADADGVVRWSYLGVPPRDAISGTFSDLGVVAPDEGTAVDFP